LQQAQQGKKERSILSVLAFCHFSLGDFHSAAGCYHDLVKICPDVPQYHHHLA
jgi:tetratricopeptide repeat protein 30